VWFKTSTIGTNQFVAGVYAGLSGAYFLVTRANKLQPDLSAVSASSSLMAVLAYVGDATHPAFLNSSTAALISAAALALERRIEEGLERRSLERYVAFFSRSVFLLRAF
jgi:hypothetical protein